MARLTVQRDRRSRDLCFFLIKNHTDDQIRARCKEELKFIFSQKVGLIKNIKVTSARAHITEFRNKIREMIPPGWTDADHKIKLILKEEHAVLTKTANNITEITEGLIEIHKRQSIQRLEKNKKKWEKNLAVQNALKALNFLKLPEILQETIEIKSRNKVIERLNDITTVDCNRYIILAENLLQEESWHLMTIGLMALTGRRPTEILKTGNFEIVDENRLLFSGQLKKRNEEDASYEIPVLAYSQWIYEIHKKLRKIINFTKQTNRDTISFQAETRRILIPQYFGDIIKNPTGRDLRIAYAIITHKMFCPKNKNKDIFMAQVLGHKDLSSIRNYQDKTAT